MNKKFVPFYIMIAVLIAVTLACGLPGSTQKEPTAMPEVGSTQPTPLEVATATDEMTQPISPTLTNVLVETEPPSSEMNSGQIAFRFDGQVWRYLVDSGEMIQVSLVATGDEVSMRYGRAQFSPDGRYLAYNLGNSSWIQDFETDTSMDISSYGQFFAWGGEETQFYVIQGEMECPAIEDLEDQELLNFDILIRDVTDLSDVTLIANVGGGLRLMQAISPDGEWASINICGCYSECGPASLWHLPTLSVITPPAGMEVGNFDFSPDSQQMTVSPQQMYGYVESALYVANTDYSELIEVFLDANSAPLDARWSPDGEWIAFTSVYFDDELTETDRCVWLVKPDGTQETEVECAFAELAAWSPDGTQLLYSKNDGSLEEFFIYDLLTGTNIPIPIQVDPYTKGYIDWGRLP
jgi:Tol biopolymer transport system component